MRKSKSIFKRVIIDINDRDNAGYVVRGISKYRVYFLGFLIKEKEVILIYLIER